MTDLGENEIIEEETPIVKIVPHRLLEDNQGFGMFRGGSGYQVIGTVRRSDMFGFMTTCTGSKFPTVYGLFGGYGAPSYPLCKIKGVNAFDKLKDLPESEWTIPGLMNGQPFEGAKYSTHHMGMQFEIAKQGELYMICQGAGGGYGDPLDRSPESVVMDLRDGLISERTAKEIYFVAYDERTLSVDVEGTEKARQTERERRKQRARPFDEFVKDWVTEEPPQGLPYYGPWGDRETIYLGDPSNKVARGTCLGITMTDPREVRIAELEQKLRDLGVELAK
jgi:N-methylhydantoinase B/oxoprolinase/acetone carboxylase alpha subunit